MDWNTIRRLWWACIYDQYYCNQNDDIDLLLSLLGMPKNVLEVCCGTGRILVPLAKAGHTVVGFDRDSGMLSRLPAKSEGLINTKYYLADALTSDWGNNFDVVILADNVIENIDAAQDYKKAQELFIRKAASALKSGGHFFLVFDLYNEPQTFFTFSGGGIGYHGTDDWGVYGQHIKCKSSYEPETKIASGDIRLEMTLPSGETHVFQETWSKYVLDLSEVHLWLDTAGFIIEQEFEDYKGKPISETANCAIIYARKEW